MKAYFKTQLVSSINHRVALHSRSPSMETFASQTVRIVVRGGLLQSTVPSVLAPPPLKQSYTRPMPGLLMFIVDPPLLVSSALCMSVIALILNFVGLNFRCFC